MWVTTYALCSYYDDVIERSGRVRINCARGHWLYEDCAEDHKDDRMGQDIQYCLDLSDEVFSVLFFRKYCTFHCASSLWLCDCT